MKNIIKHIATVTAALLLTGLTAAAQNYPEGSYRVVGGVGFNKHVTDNHNGTFTVDLESFVTGKVKVTTEMKPVDVALVLDVSGSMEQAVSGTYIQESHYNYYYVANSKSPLFATSDADNKNYNYYYKDGDAYYKIEAFTGDFRDTPRGDRVTRYILQYKKNGTNYLIGPEGPVQANATYEYDPQTTVWTEEGKTCSFTKAQQGNWTSKEWFPNDNVYRYKSRIELLKEATKSFVNTISYYDTHNLDGETIDRAHHQIAIVTFSDGATALQGFTGVENVSAIETKVDEISVHGYTRTNLGVSKAMELIDGLPAERKTNSNKVMVLFTDGNPGSSTTFDTDIANGAIGAVTAFKNPDGAYKGVVYSIGMGLSGSNATNFMNYVSSNYPYAASMANPGAAATIPAGDPGYSQSAGGADLSDIFDTIAETAAGGSDIEVSSAVVTVDVVSKAFDIPQGDEVSKPTVLLANLNGKKEGTNWDPAPLTTGEEGQFVFYTFDTPVEQDVTVDPNTGETPSGIKLIESTDAEGNEKLEVEGFNYSVHWCGPDSNNPTGGYHTDGQKLILRFTVKPSEAAVGGPEVQTNTEDSGIYVDGKRIATFNQPTVELPVNLWIKKTGLTGNDSAVFTIYYADPTEEHNVGKDPHEMDYKSFTKVSVNSHDTAYEGGNIVKITGLDSKFYYKIKEDAWAWTYDYTTKTTYENSENETVTEMGVIYTCDVLQNPLNFENKPKETVKQAEAVKRNTFQVLSF